MGTCGHSRDRGNQVRAIAQRRVRVAVGNGGELLGFSVVADGGRGVCELDDLFVDPEMLRRGVGRALVEDAAVRATATGGVGDRRRSPAQLPLLRGVGFVAGEPVQTRFGPAVRMWRKLERGCD